MKKLKSETRVDWADLDLFGHVNNVIFFRYIQSARVNFCEQVGLTSLNNANMLSFMVASSQCTYKKPLHYPGVVTIQTQCNWTKNSSFQLSYVLYNGETLIAEGEDVLVVFDHVKKEKVNIPHDLRALLEAR
jgi:acyl-CoA thioester hydrolase